MSNITLRRDKGIGLTYDEVDDNFEELDKIPNGKVFPKEEGKGILIDTDDAGYGFHDLIGIYCTPTENPPENTKYIGNICAKCFNEGSQMGIRFHLPHDYKLGTDMFIHVHWSHNSDKVTGGSVTWAFEATYAKGYDTDSFDTPIVVPVTQTTSNVSHQHMVAETALSISGGSTNNLDTDTLEVDGLILTRFFLDSNDLITSDGSEVKPFFHFVDIHYQSTGIPTKNKNPNFYE